MLAFVAPTDENRGGNVSVKGVRLLFGEDAYLLEKRVQEFIEEVRAGTGEEPECLFLDGEETGKSELMDLLEFVPLFAHFRVIVIRRPRWFGKPGTKAAQDLAGVEEVLLTYLENPNPFQLVLITTGTIDRSNPLAKVFLRRKIIEEYKKPGAGELEAWIKAEFEKRGVVADGQVVRQLASSGCDMFCLENQIEKISLCFGEGRVTLADVEEMIEGREELNIFRLTDALLKKDVRSAHAALQRLLVQGAYPVYVVYMITRQLFLMARIKALLEKGHSLTAISTSLGLKPKQEFMVKKINRVARNFCWEEIEAIFGYLLETDIAIKSSGRPDEKILLEMLVASICNPDKDLVSSGKV